jgi:hypothetical protein
MLLLVLGSTLQLVELADVHAVVGVEMLSTTALQESTIKKEVYIVVIEGEPVVAYNGHLPGFTGTAKFFTRKWKSRHHR